jgi:phytoene dehydrogenase-like protein
VADAKETRIVIVGAGLAGLACARRLAGGPARPLVLEAASGVGGRTRTDLLDGFRLDRGFHLFLRAFPEARRVLDYEALDLRPFAPEAYIRYRGRFHHVADPLRRPSVALMSLGRPIGGFADKFRLLFLRLRLCRGTLESLLARPETTTLEALRAAKFSDAMIDRLFRPLFGGMLLDRDLGVSSRAFEFLFRMLAEDAACLPAAGIGAIPEQIAAALPDGTLRLNAPVSLVEPGRVLLRSGDEIRAAAIVVATEGPEAARFLGTKSGRGAAGGGDAAAGRGARGVTCLHFAATRAPFPEPIVVLDADREGPIDTLAVISNVAPARAPAGGALIAATMTGIPVPGDSAIEPGARAQMETWFGRKARDWRLLRIDRIPYAHPNQDPPALDPPRRPVRARPGLYVCGDQVDNASIDGALTSGRRAAEAVLGDLGRRG